MTTQTQPLGIGIIGAGQRCMYFFAPYIAAHPQQTRLVALTDHDPQRLRGALAELEASVRSYDKVEALLRDPEVDAVIIATPDYTHRQMFDRVLDAGKQVLCEKPMATTVEDAVHMARRAAAVPQTVLIGFMLRYAPFFGQLKALLDAEAIGPLLQVSAVEVVEYYHGAAFFRRWHRFRQHSGGLLVHKACHTLDAVNWLVNSTPVWVSARGGLRTFVPNPQAARRCRECALTATCPAAYRSDQYNYIYQTADERCQRVDTVPDLCVYNAEKDSVDHAALLVHYGNGVALTFTFTTTGSRHERHLLLVGQRGQIRASQADGIISVEPYGQKPQTTVLPEEWRGEHGGGDAPLMEEFLRCVATGARPTADVAAGLQSVALADGATRSIDQGGVGIDLRQWLDT